MGEYMDGPVVTGYRTYFYEGGKDAPVGGPALMSQLPTPGMFVLLSGRSWKVEGAQAVIPKAGSMAAREPGPALASVLVSPSEGLFA